LPDVPANTSTTSSITVGGIVNGQLETATVGDHDWYRINLTAGQSISITLAASGANGVEDTYLSLRDSTGKVIKWNDDSGGQMDLSKIAFTATSSGTYYIDAGSFDSTSADWDPALAPSSYAGSYTLSVQAYTAPPLASYDTIATQLISGWWTSQGTAAHHFNVTQGGTITYDIDNLNADGQKLATAALALWSDIIGVTFQRVDSEDAQIYFDDSDPDGGAYTEDSSSVGFTTQAWVNISDDWLVDYGASLNSYSFQTYVHEIGHALGLGHAGNYNGDADYLSDALFQNDAWSTSIMSYFSQSDNTYFAGMNYIEDFAVTPMNADIVAMQRMYGLSTTTRTGDTTYGFNSNAGRDVFDATKMTDVVYTIFDSAGSDTLDYSGFSQNQTINLNAETFSNVGAGIGNVMIARGVTIENAIGGSGSDTLIGNAAANKLTGGNGSDNLSGNDGDDMLDGGAGADTLSGGAGNDRIVYDSADNAAQVTGGIGTDTLVVNSGAAPTSFNLTAQGFEAAEVRQTDTGSNAWSTITSTYNASWQLLNQDIRNDNGTRTYTAQDAANAQSWTQVWFNYDAAGKQVSEDYRYDNGTRSNTALDPYNAQSWTQVWFTYNASGQQISEDYRYDDGRRSWVSLDAGNKQAWSQIWYSFDAQGRQISEDQRYDDNSRSWIGFDAANSQNWSQSLYHFDAAGRLESQELRYDDNSRMWTGYDTTGTQAWDHSAYLYNATGQLYEQVITWDNGTTTYNYF
jgi:hypothetical protein